MIDYDPNTKGIGFKLSENNDFLIIDRLGLQILVEDNIIENDHMKFIDNEIMNIFLEDFMIEVSNIIIICVGENLKNDQILINRIKKKCHKIIIIIHNYKYICNLKSCVNKIDKEIKKNFNVQEIKEGIFIEKRADNNIIYHIVFLQENIESSKQYNLSIIQFIHELISIESKHEEFKFILQLKEFLSNNYKKYLIYMDYLYFI